MDDKWGSKFWRYRWNGMISAKTAKRHKIECMKKSKGGHDAWKDAATVEKNVNHHDGDREGEEGEQLRWKESYYENRENSISSLLMSINDQNVLTGDHVVPTTPKTKRKLV